MKKNLNRISFPDKTNNRNYVFDTCVYDKKLCKHKHFIDLCKQSIDIGYQYFISDIQYREMAGIQDRTGDYSSNCTPSSHVEKMHEVCKILEIKTISCLGNIGYLNLVILDDSSRIIPSKDDPSLLTQMFYSIDNGNNNHRRDAIIAESSIHNGCTLITADKRLYNKVTKFFPDKVLYFDEFIYQITNEVGKYDVSV